MVRASLGEHEPERLAQIWPIHDEFIVWPPKPMTDLHANEVTSAILADLRQKFPQPIGAVPEYRYAYSPSELDEKKRLATNGSKVTEAL